MNEYFKKSFSTFIVVVLIISSAITLVPQKAHAQYVVIDPALIHTNIAQTVSNVLQWAKDFATQGFRDAVVHEILNLLSDQVIHWIQGDGSPQFVTNWESYSNQAYARGENEAWQEIPADYICPEFRDDLQRTLGMSLSDNSNPSTDGFAEKIKCTLDSGGNVFEPQNNLYGAVALIKDEMTTRGTAKADAAQNEAVAGQGYLSAKKCLETSDAGDCIREIIATPGQSIKDVVSKALTINFDFISNVESPFSALANALINRFIQGGLDQMGLSSSSGGTTISASGSGWSEQSSSTSSQLLAQLISDTQGLLNHENSLLNIKQQSLSAANAIVASRCSNGTEAAAKVASLTQEIAVIQSTVSQLSFILNEAQSATTPADQQKAQNDYNSFIVNNGDVYQNFLTNDDIDAAQQELRQLQFTQQRCSII
ncbi:MAG: hypothetical protein WC297_02355 [Candidatus Paceibacterota bacterium]|jgi:hypothetical protein